MKSFIKINSLFLLFSVVIAAHAMDNQQTRINDIKKNREYLYGEATMPTQEDAASLAYEIIQHEVLSWAADRVSRPIDRISLLAINNLVDTIVLRRVDMIRVFAYVKKNDLMPMFYDHDIIQYDSLDVGIIEQDTQISVDTMNVKESPKTLLNENLKQELQHHFFAPKNGVLRKIGSARNFFELRQILPPLKADGSISDYGKLATAEKVEECYLIVYDIAGNIKALLGKGEETRLNLKTGKTERLDSYRGCGAIWFTLTEK